MPPDEIELMKVVARDVNDPKEGVISYYLFRFRTLDPHWAAKNGWLAGVAGGYRKADMPTTPRPRRHLHPVRRV